MNVLADPKCKQPKTKLSLSNLLVTEGDGVGLAERESKSRCIFWWWQKSKNRNEDKTRLDVVGGLQEDLLIELT